MSHAPQPSLPEPPRPRATLGRLTRLMLKELREILRDRRTIVTLVLMPVLVYPLLSIGFSQFLRTNLAGKEESRYYIALPNDMQREWLFEYLRQYGSLQALPDGALSEGEKSPVLELHAVIDVPAAVETGTADVGVDLQGFDKLEESRFLALDVEILVPQGYRLGEQAAEYIEHAIARANVNYLQRRLTVLGIEERAEPLRVSRATIESGEVTPGVSLLTALPLILILMTITGAVYPAIDLTAGERERGTLEILVAAPVPRVGLLLAKYVSVLTVALLTATVNLATMTVTILLSGLGPTLVGQHGITPSVVAEVFALLVLFAGFFSAVLLCLTSFARSFKEAQAYLIPLMLLSLAPGLLSLMPGLELSGLLAVAPLVNIVLLGRDLLEQNVDPLMAVIVVFSTFFYAAAAIGVAAKVFGSEDVLFNVQGSWSDWLARPARPRAAPTVATALFCLALIFPTFFVLTNAMARATDLPLGTRLLLSGAGTALLFAGFPLAAAWLRRDPLARAFQFSRPALVTIPAALLLGISLWPWAHELILWQHDLGLVSLGEEQLSRAREFLTRARDEISLPGLLLSMALLPGICEELFFRGYLFRALRTQLSGRATVITSALIFGGFHLVAEYLAIERFLPSMFLGLVLGWVCLRTGSVIPGMFLHVCHNGLLLAMAWYQPWLSAQGWGIQEQSHLPPSWLAYSAITVIAGASLIKLARRAAAGS